MPCFVALQILILVGDQEDRSVTQITILQVLTMVVTFQTLVKTLSLSRVYSDIAFWMTAVGNIISDLTNWILFSFMMNIFFAILYRVLMIDEVAKEDYTVLWGPLRWMLFTFRNSVAAYSEHDFFIGTETLSKGSSEETPDLIVYLRLIIWVANVLMFFVLLLNIMVAVIT